VAGFLSTSGDGRLDDRKHAIGAFDRPGDHAIAALPEPSVSVVVAGFTVDFHWPSRGLVAEIDGYRFHRSRRSFEDDRARDAKLQLAGWRVLRVTERRLRDQPTVIAEEVRRLLALIASRAA
jgi:hypothetical protein